MRTRSPPRVEVELPDLVKECLVADAQHFRRIFTAPVRFLQSVGDGFHLRLILQASYQRLEALLPYRQGLLARRSSLPGGGHFNQLAETAFVILEDDVTLHEIFQLPQVTGPGITNGCFYQMLRGSRSRLLKLLAVLIEEMPEQE